MSINSSDYMICFRENETRVIATIQKQVLNLYGCTINTKDDEYLFMQYKFFIEFAILTLECRTTTDIDRKEELLYILENKTLEIPAFDDYDKYDMGDFREEIENELKKLGV